MFKKRQTADPEPLPVDPIPFNIAEHGARYRRQSKDGCAPDGIQYILFVLDTSSSVREEQFDNVIAVLSELLKLFCKPIRVAVMTFDHEYFMEFCFDCFDGSCDGRRGAYEAMSSIQYRYNRTGIRYTHTAGAVDCVCDHMLHHELCNLPKNASCVDVIFITDGLSNDPDRNVCSDHEMLCLHNISGVNTFAFGIGVHDLNELKCITHYEQGEFNLFNFGSFKEFQQALTRTKKVLEVEYEDPYGNPYICVDPSPDIESDVDPYVGTDSEDCTKTNMHY